MRRPRLPVAPHAAATPRSAHDQTFPAIEAYSGAVALRPDAMLPRLRRGEAYRRRGDLDAAVRDFREAAALDLAATRPREELGDGAVSAAAIPRGDRGVSVGAGARRPRCRASSTSSRSPAIAPAISSGTISLLTRIGDGPESTAEMHYLLGLALRDAGRRADAQRAFEKAVAISPGLIAAREELADVYGQSAAPVRRARTTAGACGARPRSRRAPGRPRACAGECRPYRTGCRHARGQPSSGLRTIRASITRSARCGSRTPRRETTGRR